MTTTSGNAFVVQLCEARDRLDASVNLLGLALDLRERLDWGLDLDDMIAEVDLLKYAVSAHRWWRSTQ